ncbi:hypothetical protein K456DRAFT_487624 [Colletotrichum gloeosporioides 23]|nr:hypothetical protein K456DRAFT_487624 [Colletotrichum gloeosporioides 23]
MCARTVSNFQLPRNRKPKRAFRRLFQAPLLQHNVASPQLLSPSYRLSLRLRIAHCFTASSVSGVSLCCSGVFPSSTAKTCSSALRKEKGGKCGSTLVPEPRVPDLS